MLLRIAFLFFISFGISTTFAQEDTGLIDKSSLPHADVYEAKLVVDSVYGITMYEKLNKSTGGDSIRKKHGRVANAWIEDFYTSGKLLHKGYYHDGQLKVYKNYYENGNLERNFRAVDDFKSNVKLYYSDGNLKYNADYKGGIEVKTTQYYSNGKMEFEEVLDKSTDFFSKRINYFENGNLEKEIVLKDKKKMLFTCKEYYVSGILKEEGFLFYNSVMSDYQKDGLWKLYDNAGKLIAEQTYTKNEMIAEKKF
ncbi:MAG: hypothetical protein V4667_03155 [Bacteroidota bacterium]